MLFDTDKSGWRSIYPEFTAVSLEKFILEYNQGERGFEMSSREAWTHANKVLPSKIPGRDSVSRASIIIGLNKLEANGILTSRETTGQGGYHKVYRLAESPDAIEKKLMLKILAAVNDSFPTAFKAAVGLLGYTVG